MTAEKRRRIAEKIGKNRRPNPAPIAVTRLLDSCQRLGLAAAPIVAVKKSGRPLQYRPVMEIEGKRLTLSQARQFVAARKEKK